MRWPGLHAAARVLARHATWPPALAGLLLLLACAMPPVALPRDTFDAVVIFDITQSMDVEDVAIDGAAASRLALAREAARRTLRALPCGSRVGWGAFTEYRTLMLLAPIEVCANYGDLLATLDGIDGRIRWGNASEISKGVFWAMRAAKELESKPAVIFITDGQESPPLGASNFPLFDDLAPGQIGGWLVGVGGNVPRPIPRTDGQGNRIGYWRAQDVIQRDIAAGAPGSREQLSELNETHLRALSAQVGFGYAALAGPGRLADLVRDPRLARRTKVATDLSWLPAGLALLLLAGYFMPTTRPRLRRFTRTSGT
ncbi:MAG: VWA domain-containing protein [Betaproteobacteria bacterium]